MQRFTKPFTLAASCLLLAGTAYADATHTHPAHADDDAAGIGITAGAGITGFTDDQSNDIVTAGGMWELRGIIGVNNPIAFEAAYLGSLQNVDVPLVDASVMGNGLEGAVRVNLGTFTIQPYAVAGAGWMHYTLRVNEMEVEFSDGSDDVFTIPVGAGLSFYAGPALIDVRGTYRLAFDDELLAQEGDLEDRESLDSWSATARAGFTF